MKKSTLKKKKERASKKMFSSKNELNRHMKNKGSENKQDNSKERDILEEKRNRDNSKETVVVEEKKNQVLDNAYYNEILRKIFIFFVASYVLRILLYFVIGKGMGLNFSVDVNFIFVRFTFVTDPATLARVAILNSGIISVFFSVLFILKILIFRFEREFDALPEYLATTSNVLAIPFLYGYFRYNNEIIYKEFESAFLLSAIALVLVSLLYIWYRGVLKNYKDTKRPTMGSRWPIDS